MPQACWVSGCCGSPPRHGDVVALTHRRAVAGAASVTADLREATGIAAAMAKVDPTLVVHAAYAKDRELVVDATRHVVDAANAVGAHVLFISTDAVFLGDGCARDEQSAPNATWDYGRWKASAESIVLDGAEHSAIVRLPLLVSIDPDDHVVREIRAAAENGMRTRWFTDEMRQPTFASDVAAAIGAIIESAGQPDNCDRPRDIAFSDARARHGRLASVPHCLSRSPPGAARKRCAERQRSTAHWSP